MKYSTNEFAADNYRIARSHATLLDAPSEMSDKYFTVVANVPRVLGSVTRVTIDYNFTVDSFRWCMARALVCMRHVV